MISGYSASCAVNHALPIQGSNQDSDNFGDHWHIQTLRIIILVGVKFTYRRFRIVQCRDDKRECDRTSCHRPLVSSKRQIAPNDNMGWMVKFAAGQYKQSCGDSSKRFTFTPTYGRRAIALLSEMVTFTLVKLGDSIPDNWILVPVCICKDCTRATYSVGRGALL